MFNKIYASIKNKFKLYKKELIFLLLFAIIINIRFPYYIDAPGGTLELDKRIVIPNGKKVNGSLNLVYVLELEATIPTLTMSLFKKDWDVIKKEEVVASNESIEDANNRGKITLKESMNNAVYYALKLAGKEVSEKGKSLYVIYVASDAKTSLKVGDQILKINDTSINDSSDIANILADLEIGDKAKVTVKRNDALKEVEFEIIEYEGEKKIGISITSITEYESSENIEFNYQDSESGSSGGFMNTLYIYSSLIDEDIIKGKKIVGTGTISESGNVGEIGGIEYKIKAANKAKADIFFVPKGNNCDDAKKVKSEKNYNLNIVCISTFTEAIEYLKAN
jgi:Lon-like protease